MKKMKVSMEKQLPMKREENVADYLRKSKQRLWVKPKEIPFPIFIAENYKMRNDSNILGIALETHVLT